MALVPAKHKIETKSEVPKRNMIESSPIKHATRLLLGVASLIPHPPDDALICGAMTAIQLT
jgi:hypothetical protein